MLDEIFDVMVETIRSVGTYKGFIRNPVSERWRLRECRPSTVCAAPPLNLGAVDPPAKSLLKFLQVKRTYEGNPKN